MSPRRARLKSDLPRTAVLSPQRRRDRSRPGDTGGNGAEPARERSDTAGETSRLGGTAERTMTSKRRLQRRVTPLAVLQQPIQAGVRKVFDLRRFVVVIGLTVGVLFLPAPEGLTPEAQRAIALFVFTGAILALEPAPLPIAALMVPIGQVALGIDTVTGAFSPFGTPILFLILGSLFLAEALSKHGLTRRMALQIIVISGGSLPLLVLGIMASAGLLSMWFLNTATAAVLIPVAITIAQRVQPQEKAPQVLQLLVLGIAYSTSIGGMGTVMGSGENAIASGQLGRVSDFGFVDWLAYGLPTVLLLIPLSWFLLTRVIHVSGVQIDTLPALREIVRMGGLRGAEREIVLVLAVSILLWLTGSWIETSLGLPATLLSSVVVAIGAVAVLSIEEIIDWNDLKGVNWGVFLVIGAGLTLGDALDKSGASAWFAGQLAPWLDGLPYLLVLAILVFGGFFVTQLMNNVAVGAIIAPVLITLGQATGIPPERLVIPAVMAVGLAFVLPGGSARMSLVAVTGAVPRTVMLRAGLLVGLPCATIIMLFYYGLSLLGLI
jgi:solute carrier family 13 (sodium-dependent dicarboxylate transporter), member 2/3/5